MIKSKENEGITLITVVIAVILMLILVGIGTNTGIEMYKQAKIEKFINQMQLIQSRVDEVSNANEIEGLGNQVSSENKSILLLAYNNEEISNNTEEYLNNFKYFSEDNLKNQLDLENIDTPVLLNFSTREVVSTKGVEYKGRTYYTQYKLPQSQTLVTTDDTVNDNINFTVSKEMDGLNCTIRLTSLSPNCKLIYGEGVEESEVTEWKTISNYTKAKESYLVNITKSGTYIFKMLDNSNESDTSTKTISVVTTNSPKTEVDVGHHYDYANNINHWSIVDEKVWIPRFAYNKNDSTQIKFIKGNSNIATDNTYIDLQDWIIPSIFSRDYSETTGRWISESLIELYMVQEYYNLINLENDIQKIQYIITHNNVTGDEQIEGTSQFETVLFSEKGEKEFNGEENSYLIPTRK